MEGDEAKVTREEFQRWIRRRIKRTGLIPSDVREKCSLLQSLLERREKQAARLLELCESVAACEAIVRKQYSLLGWEYRDTDSSSSDDEVTGHGRMPSFPCESDRPEKVPSRPSTGGTKPLSPDGQGGAKVNMHDIKLSCLKRQPRVVLTRIPEWKMGGLLPPRPPNHAGGGDFSRKPDADIGWGPEDGLSGSGHSASASSSKRRKTERKDAETAAAGKPTPRACTETVARSPGAERATETAGTREASPVSVVSPACESVKIRPGPPQTEITLHMTVLAKWRELNWKRGEIVQIISREDGKRKYKVKFGEKGKALVSAHHLASDAPPTLEQVCMGARVVATCECEPRFRPGVVAELPTKENRSRFLVFIDDQTSLYVGLPSLYLVCKPLMDPLDDILNDTHRNFIREYLKAWPSPSHSPHKRRQHTEWFYQGSVHFKHINNFSGQSESKQTM